MPLAAYLSNAPKVGRRFRPKGFPPWYKPSLGARALAKYEVLTEEEKARGVITRKIPEDAGSFKVYYKNAYGVWTHPLTKIR